MLKGFWEAELSDYSAPKWKGYLQKLLCKLSVFPILNKGDLDLGAQCRTGEKLSPLNWIDFIHYFLFSYFSLTG